MRQSDLRSDLNLCSSKCNYTWHMLPEQTSKVCTKCKVLMPLDKFATDLRLKYGVKSTCKKCNGLAATEYWRSHPERRATVKQQDYARNKHKRFARRRVRVAENPAQAQLKNRKYHLKRYGLTQEDFTALLEAQDRCCAICEASFSDKKVCVDHNHLTGAVRGLLCIACNFQLGVIEKRDFVEKANSYLAKYHKP